MNGKLEAARSPRTLHTINSVMLALNFLMALGVIAIKFARKTYAEISDLKFAPEGPVMDSMVLDLLLRKGMVVFVIAFLVALVVKERKIHLVKHRLYVNLAAFATIAGYATFLIYLIYSPVLSAS